MTKNALISVYDKTCIEHLANYLTTNGYTIYSTGGTYNKLADLGLGVSLINISEYTQSPEICDGRVKTLHPKIFGGLLGKSDNESHVKDLDSINGIFFDKLRQYIFLFLIILNLLPFLPVVLKTSSPFFFNGYFFTAKLYFTNKYRICYDVVILIIFKV